MRTIKSNLYTEVESLISHDSVSKYFKMVRFYSPYSLIFLFFLTFLPSREIKINILNLLDYFDHVSKLYNSGRKKKTLSQWKKRICFISWLMKKKSSSFHFVDWTIIIIPTTNVVSLSLEWWRSSDNEIFICLQLQRIIHDLSPPFKKGPSIHILD